MIEPADITGIILCGGDGTRFAGRDKPLEPLAGEPMVAHVARRLTPQVHRVVVSCNRNAGVYARWGDVVTDRIPGLGPLGGVASALEHTVTPWAFVCPGDAPLLASTLVATLARAAETSDAKAFVPFDGKRRQHLFLLLHRSLQGTLDSYLTSGGRSVHEWLDACEAAAVDATPDHDSFVNINSAEALTRLAREAVPR